MPRPGPCARYVIPATASTSRKGRLTFDELLARLDATFAASTQGEIAQTVSDLPQLPAPKC